MAIGDRDQISRQKSGLLRQMGRVIASRGAVVEPPSSSSTTAARVAGLPTADLLDLVVQGGYAGPAWDELQVRLVRRAFPDLQRAIESGTIYLRCGRAGVGIQRRKELQVPPYPEEIAAEAVEDTLLRFGARVLPAGDWDPDRGTSLEDFFCLCCLPDLANRWRWHLRHLPESSVQVEAGDEDRVLTLPARPSADPAEAAERQGLVAEALTPMKPVDRIAFVLLAAGWSREEIAQRFVIERDALDARVSRARKAARARRTP